MLGVGGSVGAFLRSYFLPREKGWSHVLVTQLETSEREMLCKPENTATVFGKVLRLDMTAFTRNKDIRKVLIWCDCLNLDFYAPSISVYAPVPDE